MNTPSPDTDAAYIAWITHMNNVPIIHATDKEIDLWVESSPPSGWNVARTLEQQRDVWCETAKKSAIAHVKCISERDQLRKVCDELAKQLKNVPRVNVSDDASFVYKSISSDWNFWYAGYRALALGIYNQLPHVIERNK